MPAPPLVSVVLPAYNHERFVAQAVASVLGQTLADWELIAIDDGSTDRTAEILHGFDDARIRVLTQPNSGSHATINRGFGVARGRYLAVLNSDDVYHPQRLAWLEARARAHGGDYFACTAVRLIDAHGAVNDDPAFWWNAMYRDILRAWDESDAADPQRALHALLWGNFAVSTSNFFCTRGVVERCGRLPHLRYVLDWAYALRVAGRMPHAFVFERDAALLDYRLHGRNTILGGALRNHVEASFVLRSALGTITEAPLRRAVRRIHYLDRFLRQREVHERQEALNRLAVEHARQGHKLELTEQHVAKLERALGEADTRASTLEEDLARQRDAYAALAAQACSVEAGLRAALADTRSVEARLRVELADARAQAQAAQQQLQSVLQSRSWRVTAPLRRIGRQIRRAGDLARRLDQGRRQRGLAGLLRHAVRRVLERPRPQADEPAPAPAAPAGPAQNDPYGQWVARQQARIADLRRDGEALIAALRRAPVFSIIVPVFETDAAMLQRMIESVTGQIYPHWQLCIADDASSAPHVDAMLAALAAREPRVRVHRRDDRGHICASTNSALDLASGEYVVFLDHDDELAPHALLALAQHIDAHPDAALIYSDEDKIGVDGRNRTLPLFKPDWSPALAWTQNYMGHLVCARADLVRRAGGLRAGVEGAQDYDLFLRLVPSVARVDHVADVLYHWRAHAGSTAMNSRAKSYAHAAGRRAVESFLRARYGARLLRVDDGAQPFVYGPRFALPAATTVSIIVPTRDKPQLLRACIESILGLSTWQRYEVIVVDNNSEQPETFRLLRELAARDDRVRVAPMPIPFNWSRLNNRAARQAHGDVLLFLNNDTVVITPDWIERLAEVALLPDVGTVGPLLLFADGTVQHAGVVVGMGGWADHVYRGCAAIHFPSPFVSAVTTRNVLANTGACLAVERRKFEALGGFDEAFTVCGSDVEFGLRVHRRGWQNIYLATVRLTHFESKTRGTAVPHGDFVESERKYAPYRTAGDPFFNPNLSLDLTVPTVQG